MRRGSPALSGRVCNRLLEAVRPAKAVSRGHKGPPTAGARKRNAAIHLEGEPRELAKLFTAPAGLRTAGGDQRSSIIPDRAWCERPQSAYNTRDSVVL